MPERSAQTISPTGTSSPRIPSLTPRHVLQFTLLAQAATVRCPRATPREPSQSRRKSGALSKPQKIDDRHPPHRARLRRPHPRVRRRLRLDCLHNYCFSAPSRRPSKCIGPTTWPSTRRRLPPPATAAHESALRRLATYTATLTVSAGRRLFSHEAPQFGHPRRHILDRRRLGENDGALPVRPGPGLRHIEVGRGRVSPRHTAQGGRVARVHAHVRAVGDHQPDKGVGDRLGRHRRRAGRTHHQVRGADVQVREVRRCLLSLMDPGGADWIDNHRIRWRWIRRRVPRAELRARHQVLLPPADDLEHLQPAAVGPGAPELARHRHRWWRVQVGQLERRFDVYPDRATITMEECRRPG